MTRTAHPELPTGAVAGVAAVAALQYGLARLLQRATEHATDVESRDLHGVVPAPREAHRST